MIGDADLERFALRVVARIADRPVIETGEPGERLLRLIVRHAKLGDPEVLNVIHSQIRTQRIPAERVVDIYIPAAARRLGQAWHDGELDILGATVAIARLQAILRELGRAWAADYAAFACDARVLLAVPEREQHTLGALIAAHQLRRLGVSVNMQLMTPPAKVASLMAEGRYDALFISMANRTNLETCRKMVNCVRRAVSSPVPVVVGGPIAESDGDLCEATGADVVTNDMMTALAACGLHAYDQAAQ